MRNAMPACAGPRKSTGTPISWCEGSRWRASCSSAGVAACCGRDRIRETTAFSGHVSIGRRNPWPSAWPSRCRLCHSGLRWMQPAGPACAALARSTAMPISWPRPSATGARPSNADDASPCGAALRTRTGRFPGSASTAAPREAPPWASPFRPAPARSARFGNRADGGRLQGIILSATSRSLSRRTTS